MSQRYFKMAQMRELLLGLEDEVGLGALTQNEKDVFYASYTEIYLAGGTAKSVDIKRHALLLGMAQPTFHRCLKALIGRGLLSHAPNTKAGSYTSPIAYGGAVLRLCCLVFYGLCRG